MTTINVKENNPDELERLNQLFANRYTDEDEEYNQTILPSNTPPIVEDWGNERHNHRTQQTNSNNQQYYPRNNHQQNRHYSNDRRPYRDDPNDQQQYRSYSNDRRTYQNYSNDRRHHQNDSNGNHRNWDRDRSPVRRETRR